MLVDFDVGGQLGMPFFIIIDYWTHFDQKQQFKVIYVFVIDVFCIQTHSFLLHKPLIDQIIVMFLSTVWTIILTAPIHCKRIHWWASDVMIHFSNMFWWTS